MIWLDPLSPPVRSGVLSGTYGKVPHSDHFLEPPTDPDEIDTILVALDAASSILERRTGFAVHPAGTATEQFQAPGSTRRLTPQFSPLRTVVSLTKWFPGGAEEIESPTFQIWQGSVYFDQTYNLTLAGLFVRMGCRTFRDVERVALKYTFGSTITASARRAVLYLAHQIWLESNACEECEACQLPERTTSVTREGISYELQPSGVAAGGLSDLGQTGLPLVDSWAAGVNPRQATRRPGVYDATAPSGVVLTLATTR